MTTGDNVIGYVRVSTDGQGVNGHGLDAQKRAIREACGQRGWHLLRIEHDVGSGVRRNGRRGLDRALDAVRSGEACAIVVAKLDRLSRSVVDAGKLLDDARRGGWNIVALDFGLDLSTPQGELVANVLTSVAQWEARMAGERTREALAAARERGVQLGTPKRIPAEIAERIRSMRASGMTLRAIAAELNRLAIPTVRGGQWHASAVQSVLGRKT